jgi:hypothetical protein
MSAEVVKVAALVGVEDAYGSSREMLLQPAQLDLSVGERLEDLPRPGAPARLSADQRCQME